MRYYTSSISGSKPEEVGGRPKYQVDADCDDGHPPLTSVLEHLAEALLQAVRGAASSREEVLINQQRAHIPAESFKEASVVLRRVVG